jgi:hypothetical protein
VGAPVPLGYVCARADARPAELLFNQLFGEIVSLSLVLAGAASVCGPGEAQRLLAGINDLDGAMTDVRRALTPPPAVGSSGQTDALARLRDTVRSIAQAAEVSSISASRRAAVWDQAFQVRAVLKEVARLSDPVLNRRWSSVVESPSGPTADSLVTSDRFRDSRVEVAHGRGG